MPDVAAIIAALPPLTWRPASEALIGPTRWYVVVPTSPDHDWGIAHRDEDCWYSDSGMRLEEDPLVVAALPPPPCGSRNTLRVLTAELARAVDAGEHDQAAKLVDELADAVRAVRDSPRRR